MKSERLLYAIGQIQEEYVFYAMEHFEKTMPRYPRLRCMSRGIVAALILLLSLLFSAAVYAVVQHYSSPMDNPQQYQYPMSETDALAIVKNDRKLTPETAARELAVLFLEDMGKESKERSFRITEYRDLSVHITPTILMTDPKVRAAYELQEEEIAGNTWIVEIMLQYRYEGEINPIGPGNGEWVDTLYGEGPIGFLMIENRNIYTLQSRKMLDLSKKKLPEDMRLRFPMANTREYRISDSNIRTPEEAAHELAILFLEDLKKKSEERTFQIVEYKDLMVEVMPTRSIDSGIRTVYGLREDEVSENTWIVEIRLQYRYEGDISPIGSNRGQWIDTLHEGSPVGFLLTKERGEFRFQSRYR